MKGGFRGCCGLESLRRGEDYLTIWVEGNGTKSRLSRKSQSLRDFALLGSSDFSNRRDQACDEVSGTIASEGKGDAVNGTKGGGGAEIYS